MKEAFAKQLLEEFPYLFRNRNESSMQCGFECDDGWFDLIYTLSRDIEAAARESGLRPESNEWPLCRQVKEKLGSLRFVVFAIDGHDEVSERINDLRLAAENRSLQICEKCGNPREFAPERGIAALDLGKDRCCQCCGGLPESVERRK
jgi:hypothetical protein